MKPLLKNFLISMLFCLITFVVLRIIFSDEKTEVIAYLELFIIFFAVILIVCLIIFLVHFSYTKWKEYKRSPRRILVIGDEQCDQNQLLNIFDNFDNFDNSNSNQENSNKSLFDNEMTEPLDVQIIPDFLLTDQSPKGKLQLLQIRGSWFGRKPKLVVAINALQLKQMENEAIRKHLYDISQLIKQLSFWKKKQDVSIYISQTESIEGYSNFIQCVNERNDSMKSKTSTSGLLLEFGIQDSFSRQIDLYKPRLLQLITKMAVEQFLLLLDFFHYSGARLSQVKMALDTFRQLQETKDAKVFIACKEPE